MYPLELNALSKIARRIGTTRKSDSYTDAALEDKPLKVPCINGTDPIPEGDPLWHEITFADILLKAMEQRQRGDP